MIKPVELDYFKEFKYLRRLRSNAGGLVAFLVKQADMAQNCYTGDLWLYREGGPLPLTGSGDVTNFWWLDDETLLFAALRSEADKKSAAAGQPLTVLYRLSLSAPGEAQAFLRLDKELDDLLPLPGGRFLMTARFDPQYEAAFAAEKDATQAAAALQAERDYEVMTELPVWDNGSGFLRGGRTRLYLYENGNWTALTDEKTDVEQLKPAPDGSCAYFLAKRYESVAPLHERLMRLDLETMEQRDVTAKQVLRHSDYLPLQNGKLVVCGSDMKRWGLNQTGSFYRLDPATGESVLLDGSARFDCWNSVGTDLSLAEQPRWFAKGDTLYWVATIDDSSHVMALDTASGKMQQLSRAKGAVLEIADGGDSIYLSALRALDGPELYALQDGVERRLTELNAAPRTDYTLCEPEELFFENRDGVRIHGWVMKPAGWKAGERYPAILDIHGGPKTVYGPVVFHEMQLWASRGFGVFFCNPTGGDGGGADFADIRGRYGDIDYDDLMRFTDLVLAQNPWIDERRVGVTGGSYGGFMSNWIIGHTTRFAAAAAQRSIANWITQALTTDIGYYFAPDQTAADIWEDTEKMWAQSPLKYARNVRTPTLFIHSEEDYRCWMVEGLQMYTALQLQGVDTRLCLFRGENHELSRSGKPLHRVRRLREITEWFEKYLKKNAAE